MMQKRKIKVIIVDDSAVIRALLTEIFNEDGRFEVCASATDPYEARELIKQLNPDVLTLDIEMPKMNGITFLKNLMRLRPMPVVMISTLTQEGAPATLQALELGAVDFIPKPKNDSIRDYQEDICAKVYAAARANLFGFDALSVRKAALPKIAASGAPGRRGFLAVIGASTGGTEAIKQVVSMMPKNCPPILVTQHIPESFSASFARRVNELSAPNVVEAAEGQEILPGNVYIAPGSQHLRVRIRQQQFYCSLGSDERINRHRPSVEALFDSVREAVGANCCAALLTGMGADGSHALLRLREAGAMTIAQDQNSSVVWGMPGVAVNLGAAMHIVDIGAVADLIIQDYFKKEPKAGSKKNH